MAETATVAETAAPPRTVTPTPATPLTTAAFGRPARELVTPPGIAAYLAAEGLEQPTAFAFDAQGRLFAGELAGRVRLLEDADGDGFYEVVTTFVEGFGRTLGITFAPEGTPFAGSLYVSHRGTISVVPVVDGRAGTPRDIITGLPAGAHQNDWTTFGPDGRIYFTVGSTCNECIEEDPRSATLLRAGADGSNVEIYATGLRNAYGLLFVGEELWVTDNGSDEPECRTSDELNLVEQGRDYGWPYCEGDRGSGSEPPLADLGLNTSANGIAHAPGLWQDFELFITQYGANSGDPAIGRRVVAVAVDRSGSPRVTAVEDFVIGRDPAADFTHPLAIIAEPATGGLLVGDFGSGRVYRIVRQP